MAAGWGRPPAAAAALTLLLSLCVSLPGLLRAVPGARSASSLRPPGPSAASLRAAALRAGEVHRFITYLFVYDDLASLGCGAVAIWYFAGSLERRVGTVRLCCLTGAFTLLTALLFLLLEAPVSRVSEVEDVRGFLPVAFALLGLSTARSRMRRALVLGARVPVVLVPWLLLCAAWVIPLSSLLGNLCGLLAGQAYGLGCWSCLDLSESLACKLDRLFPFSLLKRIPGLKYIPGSSAEKRALESSEINPVPGTYPTQSYCCSSPSAPPAFQMHHPGAQSQGFLHSCSTGCGRALGQVAPQHGLTAAPPPALGALRAPPPALGVRCLPGGFCPQQLLHPPAPQAPVGALGGVQPASGCPAATVASVSPEFSRVQVY